MKNLFAMQPFIHIIRPALPCVAIIVAIGCNNYGMSQETPLQPVAVLSPSQTAGISDFAMQYFLPVKFRPIAKTIQGSNQTEVSLDGTWRICPKPEKDFQMQTAEGAGWSDIIVPGQWVQQGFNITKEETIGMSKTFTIPDTWANKRILLRFDAIHAGTKYWLNGQRLAYSENLFTPVELDITDAIIHGKPNRLVLSMKVDTPSEVASFSSTYAFHNLGGIDRSVHLFALPKTHISRLHYVTLLDKDYRDATLEMDVSIDNPGEEAVPNMSLRFSLTDPKGKPVQLKSNELQLAPVQLGENRFSPKLPVVNPLKWSAEKPHLYQLTVELYSSGKLLENVEQIIGFRQLEIKNKQLYLNGQKIKLKGALHHEVNPLAGRAATSMYGEMDAKLFKDANFNYIRTSHYPGTTELFSACDLIGLYVDCEAPFCWSPNNDDPNVTKHFLAAQAATIEYHRSHPSVIIWSLQNETAFGRNFAETLKLSHREDPSRLVISNGDPGPECDLRAYHYPYFPFESSQEITSEPRPWLFDEYIPSVVHLFPDEYEVNPGQDNTWSEGQNSPDSYVSQVHKSNNVIGGAITAGGDEQFYFSDRSIKGYGQWGFIDVWRRKKSSWWDAKLVHSPVWIPIRKVELKPEEKSVEIPVENRYSFTDLNEIKCTWEIDGQSGSVPLSLPPLASGQIKIPLDKNMQQGKMLFLRFTDEKGELITVHGVKLIGPGEGNHALEAEKQFIPTAPAGGCPKWTDDGNVITIQGERFQIRLERATGKILQDENSPPLLRWPTPFLARAYHMLSPQNPPGFPYGEYPDESTRKIDLIAVEQRGDALAIKVQDSYKSISGYTELLIDKTGKAVISFKYVCSGEPFTGDMFSASDAGLRFVFDKKCREIRWEREAEWDVYPDDNIGRPKGSAMADMPENLRNAGMTPYLSPPTWGWHLDANRFGTRDFRAAKYHIYSAELVAPDGSGIAVKSNGATTDVRANLSNDGVEFHILMGEKPARELDGFLCYRIVKKIPDGCELAGSFQIELLAPNEKMPNK